MNALAVVALLLVSDPPSLDVRVAGPAGNLGGTLTLPGRGRAPFAAVVTLTGSGAHHRDGNRTPEHPYRPFRDIANALAGCGIATLRLDDRGVGASDGDANAATAEDTAADARAALRFLRARPDIDPRRVGLVGHSYGGEIAPMVGAEDPGLAALVLLASPARPFRETMRYQHGYRIRNDPAIAPADREAALVEAMRQQEANVAASTEAWRRSIQDRDPLPTARRLRMPVLIMHGLTDRAVGPDDARMLEDAIREGGNGQVERRLFPGVNHHFQRDPVGAREGYDRLPTQELAPEVLAALCSWLSATLTPAPSLPSVTLPAPLARVLTDYEAAWRKKDAAALAALFTEDGFVLPSGRPPIRGRSAIEEYYRGHGGPLSLRALAFATEGSLGYIIGGYAGAKGEPDTGKFTLTLRRQAGRWMIMSDMDNGNARRPAATTGPAVGQVVFVCEHGTVKSVIAAHWFNRLATERNASLRAVSRGVAPDEAIPPAVARNLAEDGFDASGFTPKRLERTDVAGAVHVVAIGVESPLFSGAKLSRWDDIPPASSAYTASRDAMRTRIEALLDSLQ